MTENNQPICPVFGTCGGCQYQDIPYGQELHLKEGSVKGLLTQTLGLDAEIFEPIVPSDNTTRPIPPIVWWLRSWNYVGTGH